MAPRARVPSMAAPSRSRSPVSGSMTLTLSANETIAPRSSGRSKLEEAAYNAHLLVVALRKQGVEAYEFHDRHESLVTIGSFDSVGVSGGRTSQ